MNMEKKSRKFNVKLTSTDKIIKLDKAEYNNKFYIFCVIMCTSMSPPLSSLFGPFFSC